MAQLDGLNMRSNYLYVYGPGTEPVAYLGEHAPLLWLIFIIVFVFLVLHGTMVNSWVTTSSSVLSSSCPVAHKASTRERHCCRSAVRLLMVSHVRPLSLISFSTVHLYVSFERPRLLLPSAVQCKTVLGSAPGDIRHTCPSYLYLYLFICVATDVAFCFAEQLFIGDGVGPTYP